VETLGVERPPATTTGTDLSVRVVALVNSIPHPLSQELRREFIGFDPDEAVCLMGGTRFSPQASATYPFGYLVFDRDHLLVGYRGRPEAIFRLVMKDLARQDVVLSRNQAESIDLGSWSTSVGISTTDPDARPIRFFGGARQIAQLLKDHGWPVDAEGPRAERPRA
jgi:hypothetical protein